MSEAGWWGLEATLLCWEQEGKAVPHSNESELVNNQNILDPQDPQLRTFLKFVVSDASSWNRCVTCNTLTIYNTDYREYVGSL